MTGRFAAELRRGLTDAQAATMTAMAAGHPYEAYLHRARLAELLELAERHDVDARDLLLPEVRTALAEDRAALEQ
ncbi:hypothetical protein [Amycolatopsis panacis]|uniref:Uncharacterized protein n=1 Tax=Amycolatopsis panacis TaxID=2340917 RepID=A0A419I991_9PSEU|nr:hypothetical protein [Amycolatopsis panacis]RJQ89122.1 hypothetical protein D5S19_05505 [Amycolatopsis panacis]